MIQEEEANNSQQNDCDSSIKSQDLAKIVENMSNKSEDENDVSTNSCRASASKSSDSAIELLELSGVFDAIMADSIVSSAAGSHYTPIEKIVQTKP